MKNKEIRDILLGRIVRVDERLWAVAPADARFHFHGVKDGAGDTRLFGVAHRSRSYLLEENGTNAALEDAEPVLKAMGRPMQLESMPEKLACLYAPGWIAPVLLTIEPGEDNLKLTAYTARSPFIGRFRCRIALWILAQRLSAKGVPAGGDQSADRNDAKKETKRSAKKKAPEEKAAPLEKAEPKKKAISEEKPSRVEKKKKTAPKRLKEKTDPKRLKKKTAPKRLKK